MTSVNTPTTPIAAPLGHSPNQAQPGNTTTSPLADVLRLILGEVTPGIRPYSGDSYLPGHFIDAARAALAANDQADPATQQLAFNALSTAAFHCARGEPAKALARMRRAKSHITAMMEGISK